MDDDDDNPNVVTAPSKYVLPEKSSENSDNQRHLPTVISSDSQNEQLITRNDDLHGQNENTYCNSTLFSTGGRGIITPPEGGLSNCSNPEPKIDVRSL